MGLPRALDGTRKSSTVATPPLLSTLQIIISLRSVRSPRKNIGLNHYQTPLYWHQRQKITTSVYLFYGNNRKELSSRWFHKFNTCYRISMPSASSPRAEPNSCSPNPLERNKGRGSREYTWAQKSAMDRVWKCKATSRQKLHREKQGRQHIRFGNAPRHNQSSGRSRKSSQKRLQVWEILSFLDNLSPTPLLMLTWKNTNTLCLCTFTF